MSKKRYLLMEVDDKGETYPATLEEAPTLQLTAIGWGFELVLEIDEAGRIQGNLHDMSGG